jgi:hypothetical protein
VEIIDYHERNRRMGLPNEQEFAHGKETSAESFRRNPREEFLEIGDPEKLDGD